MRKRGITKTILTAMAFAPSLMEDSKKIRKDMMRMGKKSTKMVADKINKRSTTSMIVTGLGGYLLAHAAPIRSLIREK